MLSLVLGSSCGCLEPSLVSSGLFWLHFGYWGFFTGFYSSLFGNVSLSTRSMGRPVLTFLSLGGEAKNRSVQVLLGQLQGVKQLQGLTGTTRSRTLASHPDFSPKQ